MMLDFPLLICMLWFGVTETLFQKFCPRSTGWRNIRNFTVLEFWPILLPCIAVKTLVQIARGSDLKMLPPGDTGGEPKQIEGHCEIAEDPDLPDNDKPYGY